MQAQIDKTEIINYILFVIIKRKVLLITTGLLTFSFIIFFTLLVTPTWEATTRVLIERSSRQNLNIFNDVNIPVSVAQGNDAMNLLFLLSGENMAYDIAREFKLDELERRKRFKPRKFREKAKIAIVSIIMSPRILLQKIGILSEGEKNWLDEAAEEFLKDWQDIEAETESSVVNITVHGESGELAMDIANRMAELLKERTQSVTRDGAGNSYVFVKNKLLVAEENLRKAENEIAMFKKENNIVMFEEEKKLKVLKLEELESELLSTEKTCREVEMRLSQINKEVEGQKERLKLSTIVAKNPVIAELETLLEKQKIKLAAILIEKQKTHPEVQMLEVEIQKNQEALNNTVELDLKTEFLTLTARANDLKNVIRENIINMKAIPGKELELARLQEMLTINTSIYQMLKAKLEKLEIERESVVNEYNIVVLDKAFVSPNDSYDWPSWILSIIAGIVFSCTFGFGSIFILEFWNDSIIQISDIEKGLSLPCIGIVPEYGKKYRS